MQSRHHYIKPDILEGFRRGEENSFDTIFHELFPSLAYFAYQFIRDTSVSEDITGESFLKLWNNRGKIHQMDAIKSYLYRTVQNACIDHLRREKVRGKKEEIFLQDKICFEQSALDIMIKTEVVDELYTALNHLPDQYQRVFSLQYFDGKTIKEVAETMQLSVNTVKSYRMRGLLKLRKWLSAIPIFNLIQIFYFGN